LNCWFNNVGMRGFCQSISHSCTGKDEGKEWDGCNAV